MMMAEIKRRARSCTEGAHDVSPAISDALRDLHRKIGDFERRHPFVSEEAIDARRTHEAFAGYYESWEWWRKVLRDHFKAAWLVITSTEDDLDPAYRPFVERVVIRALCLWALFWGRAGFKAHAGRYWLNPRHELNSLRIGWWDYARSYGGWSATGLNFHPAQVRYEIFGDGEWTM
jgi:hypothetical protein